jgi:hypothetical protein
MPAFIPGLDLAEAFYLEVVRPILDAEFPGLAHSAALLGSGSEVIGCDTAMSTDHDWGPRCLLFLTEAEHSRLWEAVEQTLRHRLPPVFRGYPTEFDEADLRPPGTEKPGPINHRVEALTPRGFIFRTLHLDLDRELEPADWLSFESHRLLTIVAGRVFHDGIGLQAVRDRFAYYPHDIWLYLLAAGWMRISQEEHLMGRAGFVGDELGSSLIGSRLVRDVMRLCFLMERQYPPYAKWYGTLFGHLACAGDLLPHLLAASRAIHWQEREEHLAAAYEYLATMHNVLALTEPLPTTVEPFFARPFRVIGGERFAKALRAKIEDPAVRRIAECRLIGSVDQFSDSTDLLSRPSWRPALRRLYE